MDRKMDKIIVGNNIPEEDRTGPEWIAKAFHESLSRERPSVFLCYRMGDRFAFEMVKSFYFYAKADEERIGRIYFSSAERGGNVYRDLKDFVSDLKYFIIFIGEDFLKDFDRFIIDEKKEQVPWSIAAQEIACALEENRKRQDNNKIKFIPVNIYGAKIDHKALSQAWSQWGKFQDAELRTLSGLHLNEYPRKTSFTYEFEDPMTTLFERILSDLRGKRLASQEVQQAYSLGFAEGRKWGYLQYAQDFTLNYGRGYSDGRNSGFIEGQKSGYEEGYKKGRQTGNERGVRDCRCYDEIEPLRGLLDQKIKVYCTAPIKSYSDPFIFTGPLKCDAVGIYHGPNNREYRVYIQRKKLSKSERRMKPGEAYEVRVTDLSIYRSIWTSSSGSLEEIFVPMIHAVY